MTPAAEEEEPVHALARVAQRLGRATGLESVVDVTLAGLHEVLGGAHALLLLHDPATEQLFTIGSYGYDRHGIGAEVRVGDGIIGRAAAERGPVRVTNLQRMLRYARSVRRATEEREGAVPGTEIPLPGIEEAESQMAAPMLCHDLLVGVLAAESERPLAFDDADEAALVVVAQLAADAIELARAAGEEPLGAAPPEPGPAEDGAPAGEGRTVTLRHYAVDGSTFLDGEYVIKGVAGRLLWKLAREYSDLGRTSFTNREARLDPSLELPAARDNFESRLILLKRRLAERDAPIRIQPEARGRFRLIVAVHLSLDRIDGPATFTAEQG